jgi:hypothetical protein
MLDRIGDSYRLVMIDLSRGRISWEMPLSEHYGLSYELFHDSRRWYLTLGAQMAVFDGTTGELVRAFSFKVADWDRHYGLGDLKPPHVAGGAIWIYSQGRHSGYAPPVTVIDAETLQPRFAVGIDVVDIADDLRASIRELAPAASH